MSLGHVLTQPFVLDKLGISAFHIAFPNGLCPWNGRVRPEWAWNNSGE